MLEMQPPLCAGRPGMTAWVSAIRPMTFASNRDRISSSLVYSMSPVPRVVPVLNRTLVISPSVFRSPTFIRGQLLGDGKERFSRRLA
jgi:hypothetical protein